MFKQTIVAIVLMSLLVGNSWNTEAGSRRPPRSHNDQPVESKVREKRFFNPFPKLYSIWNALTHIYSLYVEVSQMFVLCNVQFAHTRVIFCKMHFRRNAFSTRDTLLSTLNKLFSSILFQQKNETYYALEQTYDIVADGFNDTYMSTHRPTVRFGFHNSTFYFGFLNLFDFRRPLLSLCFCPLLWIFEKNICTRAWAQSGIFIAQRFGSLPFNAMWRT